MFQNRDRAVTELAAWLRRRKPDRIVCRPGDVKWPRPDVRPWSQLADLAADAEAVLAYKGDTFLGVWQRELVPPVPAGVPDRVAVPPGDRGAEGGTPAAPVATCRCSQEVEILRQVVRAQGDMLKTVTNTYKLSLSAVRTAGRSMPDEATPTADDDEGGDDGELGMLAQEALKRALGVDADGLTTDQMLKKVLGGAVFGGQK